MNVQSPKPLDCQGFPFFLNLYQLFHVVQNHLNTEELRNMEEEEDEEGKGFLSMSWERIKARKMEDLRYRRERCHLLFIYWERNVCLL